MFRFNLKDRTGISVLLYQTRPPSAKGWGGRGGGGGSCEGLTLNVEILASFLKKKIFFSKNIFVL